MKTVIQTLLLVCFATLTHAQTITLTQAVNEPSIGDVQSLVRLDTTGFTPALTLTVSGQNVAWDLSKLKTGSDPVLSTYVTPTAVPSSTAYAGCTLVRDDGGQYQYLKSVSTPTTRTELLGMSIQSIVVTLTNSAVGAVFPISFGASNSDNTAGSAAFTGSTFPISGKVSYTADGTGTLTLADGLVYQNVLRVKTILTFTATYFFVPMATINMVNYDFYVSGQKFPVVSVAYQDFVILGNPSPSASYAGNSSSFSGVSKQTLSAPVLQLSPNPSSGKYQLSRKAGESTTMQIEIFDASGKSVGAYNFLPNETTMQLDVSGLSNGVYVVKTLSENGASSSYRMVKSSD